MAIRFKKMMLKISGKSKSKYLDVPRKFTHLVDTDHI